MADTTIIQGPPFVSATLYAGGQTRHFQRVLLDTGSVGTVFKTVDLEAMGVLLEPQDIVREITGIGGVNT